jgi:hypothetical protein
MKEKKKKDKNWFPWKLDHYLPVLDALPTITLSDEQLLEAKKVEDASPYYHSEDKGCIFEERTITCKGKNSWRKLFLKIKHCQTHNVDCCHCGWAIGHHYGTESKKLAGPRYGEDKYVELRDEYKPKI